jgi:hypothetical protein
MFVYAEYFTNFINRPNKPKNGGITAGISRAGPSRDAAVGNGADSGAELVSPKTNFLPPATISTIGSRFPLPSTLLITLSLVFLFLANTHLLHMVNSALSTLAPAASNV